MIYLRWQRSLRLHRSTFCQQKPSKTKRNHQQTINYWGMAQESQLASLHLGLPSHLHPHLSLAPWKQIRTSHCNPINCLLIREPVSRSQQAKDVLPNGRCFPASQWRLPDENTKWHGCPSWGWVIVFAGAASICVCIEVDTTSWAQILNVTSAAMGLKTSAVVGFALCLKTRCLKHKSKERRSPSHALALFPSLNPPGPEYQMGAPSQSSP